MDTHDERYKFLFSLHEAIESLVRVCWKELGIPREVVDRLDFRNMRLDSGETVRPGFKRRQADMVWVIPLLGGAPGEVIILMLEFQSEVDPKMLSRIARYVHLQLWERGENQKPGPGRPVPTMFPSVLHNGRARWNVATDSVSVSATTTMTDGTDGSEVRAGRVCYGLLDIPRRKVDDLPEDEPITWLVRIEQAASGQEKKEAFIQALRALRGKVSEQLEEALYEFAAVPDEHTKGREFISLPDARKIARQLDNLEEHDMGLTFNEFNTARYYAEIENEAIDRERQALARGREEALARGREEALARDRVLLRDLAALRFDDITAARLAEPLDHIDDFDRLREIGRWVVSCETGDELLSRLNGSRPNGSG